MKNKKMFMLPLLAIIIILCSYFYYPTYKHHNRITSVEKVISSALGVPISIGDIEIDRSAKIIKVIDFRVDNPSGYTDEKAFIFPVVEISYYTLNSEGILVSEVTIDKAQMNFEKNELGLNLEELKRLSFASKSLNKDLKELITGLSFGKVKIKISDFYYRMGFNPEALKKQHKGDALDTIEITFNSYNLNELNSTRFLNQIFIDYIEAIGQQLKF